MAIVAPQLDYTVTIIEHITQTKQHTVEKTSLGISAQSSSQAKNQAKIACYKLLRKAAELLPNERISQCCNHVAPNAAAVAISYSAEHQKAKYRNLIHCDSYGCPHCGYIRSELDRHELSVAIAEAQKRGYFVSMLTCTLRHRKGDELTDLRSTLAMAFDDTFSGRWYANFCDEWAVVGKIKSWEAPFGVNGWHPHLHVLFFTQLEFGERSAASTEKAIGERWAEKLDKLGHNATLEHGINLTIASSEIADYIAKWGREPLEASWGVEHEIAKAPVKKNKHEGLTPFELLGAAAGQTEPLDRFQIVSGIDDRDHAKAYAGKLYTEYFAAFKGKPRLYWGKMRQVLEMDEALFEYEQNNPPAADDSIDVVLIEPDEWRKVIKAELRAQLLILVEECNTAKLRQWLREKQIKAAVRLKIEGREL